MKKIVVSLSVAVAFMFLATISSAAIQVLDAGASGICEKAGWVATNQSEQKDTKLVFNVGPIGYGWGKDVTRTLAPGGYQANALAQRTVFKNKGPGKVTINCQRRATDFFHDWKVDTNSLTYQPNYSMDHVSPGTYIEPGLGQPLGTERGLFGGAGGARSAAESIR